MKNKPSAAQIAALIQVLQAGPPRAAYHAGQELTGFGSAAEAPLIAVLKMERDPLKQQTILNLLQALTISHSESVEAIIRLLSHEKRPVRASAAQCLLHSSPKLRAWLAQIEAACKQEKDPQIRETLQKLLGRYPNNP